MQSCSRGGEAGLRDTESLAPALTQKLKSGQGGGQHTKQAGRSERANPSLSSSLLKVTLPHEESPRYKWRHEENQNLKSHFWSEGYFYHVWVQAGKVDGFSGSAGARGRIRCEALSLFLVSSELQ